MRRVILRLLTISLLLYIVVGVLLFLFQEKVIFLPEKLDKNYSFDFAQNVEELNVKMKDGISLNGLLFKANSSKGVIFYLHGNAGSLRSWCKVADTYTRLNYDVFLVDYRGYGKSEGSITGQSQLFEDLQIVYDELTKRYNEDHIIVLGYSIGTGPAAKIASTNHPKMLILQAPYYSLTDMMHHTLPVVPTFILKYKFETNQYLQSCKMPVIIFHGDADEVIYYGSSIKLKEHFKKQDRLITLAGEGHHGITHNKDYIRELQKLLSK